MALKTLTVPELIELREYEPATCWLSSEQAHALQNAGDGKYLSVTPTEEREYWQVKARNYVGSMNLAGLRVLVHPKIPLVNLFLMLEVGLKQKDWRSEAAEYETTGDLLPAMISFFARTTETTLARGLYHAYREHHDWLLALRGRIDINRQLTRPGLPIPAACRYTDFTADLIENSYLKAAVNLSLRVPQVPPIDRRRMLQHLVTLEDVSAVRHRPRDHDRITFNRLNDHYKPALRLARLILANLTLQDDIGGTQASAFMLDMNYLFERFVTERLRRSLRSRLAVDGQHHDKLDEEERVQVKPDIVFKSEGTPRFVADTKYKLIDDGGKGGQGDYYQLLAYTTALDVPEGVLIYCLNADGSTPDRDNEPVTSITVRNSGKKLHTYALDLSGNTAEVADAIDRLANWIAQRSLARSRT